MQPPTLTLSNNIFESIAGTPTANQVFTATCNSGETCKIIYASNGVTANSGTTTTYLSVNSITPNSNGYISLIAQNSLSTNSPTNTIRIITLTNSITANYVNIQSTAYIPGTTVQDIISNLNFASYESTISDNNFVVYYPTNGAVIPFINMGNETNFIKP